MALSVDVDDARADGPADETFEADRWQRLAAAALAAEGVTDGTLSVVFVDEDEMAELNADHMGATGPTDVLSFPIDETPTPGVPRLLGDVVICPTVARRQAPTHAGTYDDEIALLIVHGVLHVLGHDHGEPDEAEQMRRRERVLLADHHWRGPVPGGFRHTHD